MLEAIDACAHDLRAGMPAFTRRNLLFAVRRALGEAVPKERFDAAMRRRLARGPLPGLLPSPCQWRPPRLTREWDAYFPKAVLLVDRPAILDLFVASGAMPNAKLAVACVDGSPAPVIAWLRRGFRAGRRAPIFYLHDAATVIYPFSCEPFATLVRHASGERLIYRDLGLPPLGAPAKRFADASLPVGEPLLDLEAVPPAALVSYVMRRVLRAVPGDPNMLPLARDGAGRGEEQARS